MNATVAQNGDLVDRIASGISRREELIARFDAPTGYEAYAPNERSQPYLRNTFGVTVAQRWGDYSWNACETCAACDGAGKSRVRRIIDLDLWEISIVTFPLLAGARVRAVKGSGSSPPPPSHARARAERAWANAIVGRERSRATAERRPAPARVRVCR